MGDDPFEKILKYIDEQRKMPHVATNIALKELTWPPRSKTVANPPVDIASTFPPTNGKDDDDDDEPAPPPAAAGTAPAAGPSGAQPDSAKNDEPSPDDDIDDD